MQRYFVEFKREDPFIKIIGDDYHHIKNVMRMKIDDEFYVSNNKDVFYAKISEIRDDYILCELLYEVKQDHELKIDVAIAQGMPKGDKFDFIIQKTTELGVSEIIPVLSSRSLIKVDDKKREKKLNRYKKIAKEAAEQSHRQKLPKINDFMNIKEFIEYSENFDYKLVAYEASNLEEAINLKHIIKNIEKNQKVLIFIGPEGGISEKELNSFKKHNFKVISLGQRILRTETAPLFVMSAIVYELELKG